jgi:ABC-type antimicrobial peptide transport system ATPase subunit
VDIFLGSSLRVKNNTLSLIILSVQIKSCFKSASNSLISVQVVLEFSWMDGLNLFYCGQAVSSISSSSTVFELDNVISIGIAKYFARLILHLLKEIINKIQLLTINNPKIYKLVYISLHVNSFHLNK